MSTVATTVALVGLATAVLGPGRRVRTVASGSLRGQTRPGESGRWQTRVERAGQPRDDLDPALVLTLADVGLRTGAPVPRVLHVIGQAIGGSQGAALRRAGAQLELGAHWDDAWLGAPTSIRALDHALRDAWVGGVAPHAALRLAAERMRREQRTAARAAAARLGTHLVIPLAACFLPAFVLLGLVPVVLSLTGSLLG